jgi:hypothetical protein
MTSILNFTRGILVRILLAFSLGAVFSEDVLADSGAKFTYDPQKRARAATPIYLAPPTQIGGIVPKAVRMKKPLVLINPFADPKYGYGKGLVSWDSRAGKPKGFIFASVRFW